MRKGTVAIIAGLSAACAVDDPRFGDPGAINKQYFPGEKPDGGAGGDLTPFTAPYNEASPPKEPRSGAQIHEGKAIIDDKTNCMTCHGPQPVSNDKTYSFAGRAFEGPGKPLEFGEVIVYTNEKVIATVKTTSDGFFFFVGEATPATAKAAIRDKTNRVSRMVSVVGQAVGACNSAGTCHAGSASAVDFKP